MFSLMPRPRLLLESLFIRHILISALLLCASATAYAQTPIVIERGQKFSSNFLKLDSKEGIVIINRDVRLHKLTFRSANGETIEAEVLSGSKANVNLSGSGIYDVKSTTNPTMTMTVYVPHDVSRVDENSKYYF